MVDISVILPTYNERENLPEVILKIEEVVEKEGWTTEILVVDDNSPDGTAEVARELSRQYGNIKVIVREEKPGLGLAYRRGFREARGDVIVCMDADGQHPPECLPNIVNPVLDGECDFGLGSRYVEGSVVENFPWYRKLNSWGARIVARLLLKLPYRDPTSGFRAISRKILTESRPFVSEGFEIQVETLAKAHHMGYTVQEYPFLFRPRERGSSNVNVRQILRYLNGVWRIRKDLKQRGFL
ncbi:polyprenol monophosphomannose synthase [Methanopyrus sp.]